MEGLIISLLAVNIVVGLIVLLVALVHHRQWKQANQSSPLQDVPSGNIAPVLQAATKPLSPIEKKYLVLFMEGKTTEEIAELMHVEPATVYTMKYRIRKKFPADYTLPF